MKKFSLLIGGDKIMKCGCGSAGFFDWGMEVLWKTDFGPSPRNKDWQSSASVKVCIGCHKAVVFYEGTLYDATDLVSAEQIRDLIQFGLTKQHAVPLRAMDP